MGHHGKVHFHVSVWGCALRPSVQPPGANRAQKNAVELLPGRVGVLFVLPASMSVVGGFHLDGFDVVVLRGWLFVVDLLG